MSIQSKVAGTGNVNWESIKTIVMNQPLAPRPVDDAQPAAAAIAASLPLPPPIVVPAVPPATHVPPQPAATAVVPPIAIPLPPLDVQPAGPGFVPSPLVPLPAAPVTTQPASLPAAPAPAPEDDSGKGKGKRPHDDEDTAPTSKKLKQADEQTDDDTQTDAPPPARKVTAPRVRKPKDPNAPAKPKGAPKKSAPTVDSDADPEAAEAALVGEPDTTSNPAPTDVNEIWKVCYTQAKVDMIYEAHGTVGDARCGGCILKERPACWTVLGLSCVFCKKSKIKCNREPRHRPDGKQVAKLHPAVAPGVPDERDEDIGVRVSRLERAVFTLLADRDKEQAEEILSLKQENETLRAFIAQNGLAAPGPSIPTAPTTQF